MRAVIGLDIGTTGVRAVESVTSGRSVTVKRAHAVPLGPDVIVDGQLKDEAMLVSALRQLWRRGRFTDHRVHLVMGWHPQVLVRPMDVAWLPDHADMAGLVASQAMKEMAADVSTLYLDHHVTNVSPRLTEDGEPVPWANVAVVGASRELVDKLLAAADAAGLRPASVDITPFVLTRLVSAASSGPGKVDLVVHLGASTGLIVGVVDGQPVFQQPLKEFAGQVLTEQIASALAVPLDRAEALKLALPLRAPAVSAPAAGDPTPVVAAWTTALVRACCKAVDYVTVQLAQPVGRVWLTGGGSGLPTLAPRIGAELGNGTQVTLIDPGTWVQHPERLASSTGPRQDMTVALATSMR